ncbi:MAG: hypothetical protein RQ761_12790 [Bacteroidales bacterium]|nr:hypothetical protein [Bacteroidales bacterium]
MNNILFSLIRIHKFFRKLVLKFRGKTGQDVHDERIVSGRAWEEFCDKLKLAGSALMYSGTPRDPFQQAEGVRYLSRLTRAGLEAFVEYNDPKFPVFRRMVHETVKMGADNPDNHYFNTQISGAYEYRIAGKRNTIHYLGFFTQNGNYGTTGGLAPCGVLEHQDLIVEDDGSFEITLSKEKRGKNWLKIEDETGMVMARQTFLHSDREIPAEINISRIGGSGKPEPLTARAVDEGLKTAALFVAGAPMLFAKWAKGFQKHTNKLPLFDASTSNAAGGDANIIYHHSHWKLANDEALVIEVKPPACDSWNFQLNNYWMESLDYRYFNICINKGNAAYRADGSVRVVVAHQNPGLPNWIETCGHNEGTMCWRWYRLEADARAVEPECKVVKFNEISDGE